MNKINLTNWYTSETGKYIQMQLKLIIQSYINNIVVDINNDYVLEMGILSEKTKFLADLCYKQCFYVSENRLKSAIMPDLIASPLHLPIAFDSVSLVVASHVLELTNTPHQVLRELNRILTPEGHCILIALNPFSLNRLLNLKNALNAKKYDNTSTMPCSLNKTCDWLNVLGFEILQTQYLSFLPKSNYNKLIKYLSWFNQWGTKWNIPFGKIYIIHAKKRLFSITARKLQWKNEGVISGKIIIQPSIRNIKRDEKA